MHSFGMTIDLTPKLTEYWQWDLTKAGRPIHEEEPLIYHNSLPWGIVTISEAHGFIWGGNGLIMIHNTLNIDPSYCVKLMNSSSLTLLV